jgi:Fe-S-cluster-containing dehydrogenase component/formate-dependent nitrite reductase membrane component NrfD
VTVQHGLAPKPVQWAKVIDHETCIGCHACTTACKSENDVPLSVTRTYVKYVDVGTFPQVRRAFQVTRCNQCADPPCAHACPTAAMVRRADGIVDFDKSVCIGCKACIAACPYDAIFINPEDHSAEKCNFCAHRIDRGLEPACVIVCPTQSILVGDMNDPGSRLSRFVNRQATTVRRPEKETAPKLFYRGAHHATLDPLAARRPSGGLFLWSEQGNGNGRAAPAAGSTAAAILSYDVPHRAPWDWRVSLYTLTKSVAAGAYLVAAFAPAGELWSWAAPLVAAAFLALTGVILIADLEHPTRFPLLFTRPQWRSWLVRGAFLIAGYAAVLALHLGAALLDRPGWQDALRVAGVPLAALTAVYTAWLFAQAKARDLWQSPLLPPHLLVQAVLAGSATLLQVAAWSEPAAIPWLSVTLAAACAAHLALVLGDASVPHATAHARAAAREMTFGRYRSWFVAGLALVALGTTAPWLGTWVGLSALAGLFAYEHAYVQAGQSVPLA